MRRWKVGDKVRDTHDKTRGVGVVKYVDDWGPTVLYADEIVAYAGGSNAWLEKVKK